MKLLPSILLLAVLLAASVGAQPPAGPTAEADPAGWTMIEDEGNEDCAFGTPFRFFYRPGTDPARLLIYFQGGGACWDWVSCSGMFDTSVDRSELAEYRGAFDVANPANPFRDFAMLFIPYCTGDVHIGAAERVYGEGARPVRHYGARNVERALAWAQAHLGVPAEVVVAGASAGAYGAVFHAPRIAGLYPAADLVVIADSGVPLLHGYEAILERWGAGTVLRPAWGIGEDEPLTLERAYREAAALPRTRAVVQVTSDRDAVQAAFYLISGSAAGREDSYALLDRLERDVPSFHRFIVAGADHGLLRTDAFYTYEAGGTPLAEWVGRLVEGEPVASVRCEDCVVR